MKKKHLLSMLCAAAMALTAAIAPIGNSVMLPEIVTVHADDERIEKPTATGTITTTPVWSHSFQDFTYWT